MTSVLIELRSLLSLVYWLLLQHLNLLFTYMSSSSTVKSVRTMLCLCLAPQPNLVSVWQMLVEGSNGWYSYTFMVLSSSQLPQSSTSGIFAFSLSVMHCYLFFLFSSSLCPLTLILFYDQHMLSPWLRLECWKYKGEAGNFLIYTHQTSNPPEPMPDPPWTHSHALQMCFESHGPTCSNHLGSDLKITNIWIPTQDIWCHCPWVQVGH